MAKCFAAGRLLPIVLLLFLASLGTAERIRDMIYKSFDGAAACFRRHNGTHQFGCSSSRSGSIGVVHFVEAEDDVGWIERNATAGPYTVVLPFSMFTNETLLRLRDTENVNGVLLARNTSVERPRYYSPDDTCPNRYSGYKACDAAKPWNPRGSALLLEDWPFPMFYMENQTLIEDIKLCYQTHNAHHLDEQGTRPLCAIEMKSFMFAAVSSDSCMKRNQYQLNFHPTQFCDPLGDRNIHWPLAPLNNDNNSVILVTARLDASSLFDGVSPGAGNTITGLVTLLATAYYLNYLNTTVTGTNVIFTLLNGEAFDYIGSSRMVYDLKEGTFNALGGVSLNLDEVKSVIEFGQLGRGQIYLHAVNADNDGIVAELRAGLDAKVLPGSVPPTSVQTFLRATSGLPAVVITNHADQFANRYYNGILDDAESLEFTRNNTELADSLARIAIRLAEVLYRNVTGETAPKSGDDDEAGVGDLILQMLICYLETAKCNLFRAASPPGAKLVNQVLPLYVGVHRVPNTATSLTGQLLALLTGEKLYDVNETVCHEKHLAWMAGYNFTGICVNSTVNYSIAMSPAFVIDGYDMKSGNYSTWTESIWQTLSVRMFLKPSPSSERFSLILGSVVAGASFIVVWFINSRADVLFNSRRAANC